MDELAAFLKSQNILQIAPHAGDPWIANVYMCSETPEKIYFVGSKTRLYAKQLLQDSALAFATAWHNAGDHLDRKGIQGVGNAVFLSERSEIETALQLYHEVYPKSSDLTVDWALENDSESGVWAIAPTYIKFWNDELYGPEGSKEFDFSPQ